MKISIYRVIIRQGFINEALERDFRGLNVALITVILNVVKAIPNMMKSY